MAKPREREGEEEEEEEKRRRARSPAHNAGVSRIFGISLRGALIVTAGRHSQLLCLLSWRGCADSKREKSTVVEGGGDRWMPRVRAG